MGCGSVKIPQRINSPLTKPHLDLAMLTPHLDVAPTLETPVAVKTEPSAVAGSLACLSQDENRSKRLEDTAARRRPRSFRGVSLADGARMKIETREVELAGKMKRSNSRTIQEKKAQFQRLRRQDCAQVPTKYMVIRQRRFQRPQQ